MGAIKVWLEGLGKKPAWVGDKDTGAAVQVDRATVAKLRGFVNKFLSCFRPAAKST